MENKFMGMCKDLPELGNPGDVIAQFEEVFNGELIVSVFCWNDEKWNMLECDVTYNPEWDEQGYLIENDSEK